MRRNGKLVLSEAVGIARGYKKDHAKPSVQVCTQTPFPAYSCGKPLAAVAIAMLEDRGKLDINAPIAEVFPEFGCKGKEQTFNRDAAKARRRLAPLC